MNNNSGSLFHIIGASIQKLTWHTVCRCTTSDRKEHIELLDVQLTDLELPDNLISKYLTNILLHIAEEKTQLDKNVTIVTKQTEVLVGIF